MLGFVVSLFIALQQPATAAGQPAQPPAPAGQTAPQPAPAGQPAQPPAPAVQPRRAAPAPTTLEIRSADRSGAAVADMRVTAEGPLSRGGQTNAEGRVTLRAMPPGIYRVRVEGDGFVTLEKEVTLRAATPLSVEFALNAAPPPPPPPPASPPPPPPPPPPPAAVSDLEPGEARVLSLLDLTEKSLGGRDPVKTVAVGCSGMSRSQLLVVRDATRPAARPDVDETLYLIAGEATLTLGGRDQPMTPGWFSLVPRGIAYGLVKKGRNPVVLLSVVAGVPCSAPQTTK